MRPSAFHIPFNLTAAEAAEFVQQDFDAVKVVDLESLFSWFAVNSTSAVALHAIVAACSMRRGADESRGFLRDVSKKGVISSGGVATALITETTLKALGMATGSFPAVGTIVLSAMVARGVFRRILSRDQYADWLAYRSGDLKGHIHLLRHS